MESLDKAPAFLRETFVRLATRQLPATRAAPEFTAAHLAYFRYLNRFSEWTEENPRPEGCTE